MRRTRSGPVHQYSARRNPVYWQLLEWRFGKPRHSPSQRDCELSVWPPKFDSMSREILSPFHVLLPTAASVPTPKCPAGDCRTVVAARLRALSRQSGRLSLLAFSKAPKTGREAFLRRHRPVADVNGFGALLIVREAPDPAAWIVSFLTSGSFATWCGIHLDCKKCLVKMESHKMNIFPVLLLLQHLQGRYVIPSTARTWGNPPMGSNWTMPPGQH